MRSTLNLHYTYVVNFISFIVLKVKFAKQTKKLDIFTNNTF